MTSEPCPLALPAPGMDNHMFAVFSEKPLAQCFLWLPINRREHVDDRPIILSITIQMPQWPVWRKITSLHSVTNCWDCARVSRQPQTQVKSIRYSNVGRVSSRLGSGPRCFAYIVRPRNQSMWAPASRKWLHRLLGPLQSWRVSAMASATILIPVASLLIRINFNSSISNYIHYKMWYGITQSSILKFGNG